MTADIRAIFNVSNGPRFFPSRISRRLGGDAICAAHQRRLHTSNPRERINRRSDPQGVASLFANEQFGERRVSAPLMKLTEEWKTGKVYSPM